MEHPPQVANGTLVKTKEQQWVGRKSAARLLKVARAFPIHSYERIYLVSLTVGENERLRMLRAARAKKYLSRGQYKHLVGGGTAEIERIPLSAPSIKYGEYIKSEHWERRKALYWEKHPKKCVVCAATRNIHLHHIVYGDYGVEPDEHLVSLCAFHHGRLHSIYGVKGSMVKATNNFIVEQQETLELQALAKNL